MARTKEEIFDALIAAKDANAILAPILTSGSKVAFYRNLFELIAEITGDFELSFDDFEAELIAIMESKQVHNSQWWRNLALSFQLGDPLITLENGNLGYSETDTDKQIIRRAAVLTPSGGSITLKVAKLSGSDPEPLAGYESTAFAEYINDTGPAGITATIVSVTGEQIQINFDVYIDTQIINIADGTLIADGTTKPVEDAVNAYFSEFQELSFGGTYYASQAQKTILEAAGVVSMEYNTLEKKSTSDPSFVDVLGLTGKKFETFAGYVRIADGFDLSANITYISG